MQTRAAGTALVLSLHFLLLRQSLEAITSFCLVGLNTQLLFILFNLAYPSQMVRVRLKCPVQQEQVFSRNQKAY